MITLSPRLAAIGNEIKKGETMADIGTDHGFLPISLWERNHCPKVIMTDASAGSLDKAKENCKRYYPQETFDLRLGNGLQVLTSGEVDVVVIAGMGGILMTEILGNQIDKSLAFQKIILQPRNNVGKLRHWLYHHGFSIMKEQLVREGKYICEIITAIPKEIAITQNLGEDRIEYQFPLKLVEYNDPLLPTYLKEKHAVELHILDLMKTNSNLDSKKIRSQVYRVEYLEYLLALLDVRLPRS